MKIYKRDIEDFLYKVRSKAINSVRSKYDTKIDEMTNLEFGLKVDEIKSLNVTLEKTLAKLNEVIGDSKLSWYGATSNLKNNLERAVNNTYDIKNTDFQTQNADINTIIQQKSLAIKEVEDEYRKLFAYLKSNTGKNTYEYLKSLGFDVSSIGTNDTKLPSTNIDKSKLFVCGDNK